MNTSKLDRQTEICIHNKPLKAFIVQNDLINFDEGWKTFLPGGVMEKKGPCGNSLWNNELSRVANDCMALGGARSDVLRYYHLMLDTWIVSVDLAHSATFGCADLELEYQIEGRTYVNKASPSLVSSLGLSGLSRIFVLAILLRRTDDLRRLCEFDEDFYIKASDMSSDPFDIALHRLLKGVALDITKGANSDMPKLLSEVVESSTVESFDGNMMRLEYCHSIWLPIAKLLSHIYTKDGEKAFQDELQDSLQHHRAHYMMDEDCELISDSYRSLPLMAMCALAHDVRGYGIDCSSEYLEEWLVKGKFSE
ncbi:Imm49 family immunity protein [Pelagibaculum spongiae]|nr:Imm49 family immunity protein [Pelagibaculum spongiae]